MSLFSFREFKHAFWVVILCTFIGIALLVPLNQILPDFFDSWVPDFLQNKSIIYYAQEHIAFFLGIIPLVGLVMVLLFLWRKR